MNNGTMNGKNGMNGMNMSSSSMGHPKRMMMHMTFYWGNEALILFKGWPGTHKGMYILSLVVVFLLAFIVEALSRSRLIKDGRNDVVSGVLLTTLHALRMGFAYLAMLAVMSFNGGVFIAVLAGHAIGFLVFGTRVFIKGSPDSGKGSDLPPMSC